MFPGPLIHHLSLLPTLASPLSLHMASALNCVSCTLAFISPCSLLPCLQTPVFIVLFLTSFIPPKMMLNITHPLCPELLTPPPFQILPPNMLPHTALSKWHSTAHPCSQTLHFTTQLTAAHRCHPDSPHTLLAAPIHSKPSHLSGTQRMSE